VAGVGERLQRKLGKAEEDHPLVGEVRGVGFMAGIEFVADKQTKRQFDSLGRIGAYFFNRGHEHGIIVRNMQDSIVLCPPLVISKSEVDELVRRLRLTLSTPGTRCAARSE
jgi:4-aminobutyrate--pyruvate transaminase